MSDDPRNGPQGRQHGNFLIAMKAATVMSLSVAPFVFGGYVLHLAVNGGLMALAAMPLTVLSGSAGLPSLGTAAFLSIGAFTAGILASTLGWGILPSILVAAALGLLAGALVATLTLRVSGLYLAVGTLALQRIITIVLTDLDLKMTYASGFMLDDPDVFGVTINSLYKWWALILPLLFAVYAAFAFLLKSHSGREWSLVRLHPMAGSALGISIASSRIQVFALTSAIISAVGVFNAYHLGNVQAGTYTLQLAIVYLAVAALGGAGNLLGAITASYSVLFLPEVVTSVMESLSIDTTSRAAGLESVTIGIILILALLRVPQRVSARLKLGKTSDAER